MSNHNEDYLEEGIKHFPPLVSNNGYTDDQLNRIKSLWNGVFQDLEELFSPKNILKQSLMSHLLDELSIGLNNYVEKISNFTDSLNDEDVELLFSYLVFEKHETIFSDDNFTYESLGYNYSNFLRSRSVTEMKNDDTFMMVNRLYLLSFLLTNGHIRSGNHFSFTYSKTKDSVLAYGSKTPSYSQTFDLFSYYTNFNDALNYEHISEDELKKGMCDNIKIFGSETINLSHNFLDLDPYLTLKSHMIPLGGKKNSYKKIPNTSDSSLIYGSYPLMWRFRYMSKYPNLDKFIKENSDEKEHFCQDGNCLVHPIPHDNYEDELFKNFNTIEFLNGGDCYRDVIREFLKCQLIYTMLNMASTTLSELKRNYLNKDKKKRKISLILFSHVPFVYQDDETLNTFNEKRRQKTHLYSHPRFNSHESLIDYWADTKRLHFSDRRIHQGLIDDSFKRVDYYEESLTEVFGEGSSKKIKIVVPFSLSTFFNYKRKFYSHNIREIMIAYNRDSFVLLLEKTYKQYNTILPIIDVLFRDSHYSSTSTEESFSYLCQYIWADLQYYMCNNITRIMCLDDSISKNYTLGKEYNFNLDHTFNGVYFSAILSYLILNYSYNAVNNHFLSDLLDNVIKENESILTEENGMITKKDLYKTLQLTEEYSNPYKKCNHYGDKSIPFKLLYRSHTNFGTICYANNGLFSIMPLRNNPSFIDHNYRKEKYEQEIRENKTNPEHWSYLYMPQKKFYTSFSETNYPAGKENRRISEDEIDFMRNEDIDNNHTVSYAINKAYYYALTDVYYYLMVNHINMDLNEVHLTVLEFLYYVDKLRKSPRNILFYGEWPKDLKTNYDKIEQNCSAYFMARPLKNDSRYQAFITTPLDIVFTVLSEKNFKNSEELFMRFHEKLKGIVKVLHGKDIL